MSVKRTVQMNAKTSVTIQMVAIFALVMKEECYPMTNITVSMHVVGRSLLQDPFSLQCRKQKWDFPHLRNVNGLYKPKVPRL